MTARNVDQMRADPVLDIDQVRRAAWLADILRSARSARNCVKDYMKDRPDKGLVISISGGAGLTFTLIESKIFWK